MNRVAMLLVPIIVAAASLGCAVQYQPEAPAPRYYNPHWNDASVAKHQACYDAVLDAVRQPSKVSRSRLLKRSTLSTNV